MFIVGLRQNLSFPAISIDIFSIECLTMAIIEAMKSFYRIIEAGPNMGVLNLE